MTWLFRFAAWRRLTRRLTADVVRVESEADLRAALAKPYPFYAKRTP